MSRINWPAFEQHAGLPAIDHALAAAEADLETLTRDVQRLTELRRTRYNQIAAGEWPVQREQIAVRVTERADGTAEFRVPTGRTFERAED